MGERASLWGLRFLALALALLSWFTVSGDKREPSSEKVIDTGVRYDLPEGFLLLERAEELQVGVRGPLSKIRSLVPFQVDVFIEVPAQEGTLQLPVGVEQVALPSGLEVVSVEPNIIQLTLDRVGTDVVEVRPSTTGEPAAGAIVESIRVIPNQVIVRGPASRLQGLESVETVPLDLSGHALNFEEDLAVLPPDRMISIVEPRIVTVAVTLQIPTIDEAEEGDDGDDTPDDGGR